MTIIKQVTIGDATLYLGDCKEIIPTLRSDYFDAIITDPPYGINLKTSKPRDSKVNRNTKRIIGDDTYFDPTHLIELQGNLHKVDLGSCHEKPIAIFGANNFCDKIPPYEGAWLVWDKSCGKGPKGFFADAEFIWINRKCPRCIFRLFWMGFTREGRDNSNNSKRMHVSQKPVELMLWLIDMARIGLNKTILDPYMGSGSTGVSSLLSGRKFIGIEIDSENFDMACERIQKAHDEINCNVQSCMEYEHTEESFICQN